MADMSFSNSTNASRERGAETGPLPQTDHREQDSSVSETASNFVMSVVAGVKPQDEIEAMLAIQMGAIHQATMMLARRLNHVKTLPQQDSAERALNKLARTFTSQVETLKRYRSKADQTVRVERVEVNEGGQAIVGNVQNRGRGE